MVDFLLYAAAIVLALYLTGFVVTLAWMIVRSIQRRRMYGRVDYALVPLVWPIAWLGVLVLLKGK